MTRLVLGQVGSAAEVGELALLVDGNDGVGRQLGDDLDLVVLAHLLEEADGLVARQLAARDFVGLLDDLGHLGLDAGQVLGGEGFGQVEVVVVAVGERRADG